MGKIFDNVDDAMNSILSHVRQTIVDAGDPSKNYVVEVKIKRNKSGIGYDVSLDTATDKDGDFGYTEDTILGNGVPGVVLTDVVRSIGKSITEFSESPFIDDKWDLNPKYKKA